MPDATSLLGVAAGLLRAGRAAEAVAPLRQAALLAPGNATILHDLGLACLESHRLGEAEAAFRQAVAINPRYTGAVFRLGIALERLGDAAGAVAAYDRATELLPGHTEAWFRAGALVLTLGHREAAIGCFRRAAATGPKTRFGRLGAARALLAEGRDGEAETVLRRMLALEPGNAMAQDLLGTVLAESGRFAEAGEAFARAVRAAPLMAGSYYDLVRCRRLTREDKALLPRMLAALDTPGLDAPQILRVHLALGKAADDFGDFEMAMRHFDAADAVRNGLQVFDLAAFDAQIDAMIARFTPDYIARVARRENGDATPILITGMPRSGTTLTEQILSSHQDVTAGGELNFWNERGIDWLSRGAPDGGDFFQDAAAAYLAVLRGMGASARVTDKMPFNFIWAGLIHLVFPRATILHCRRDAIDTALSIHQTHFTPLLAFPTGGAALVGYFRAYARLTRHWRSVLPAACFVEVDYEALTGAPEPAIRRMIGAAGLPWDAACLAPELNTRTVKTPSKWQARQKIYRHSVARWRRYEPFLGELDALRDLDDRGAAP